LLSGVNFTHFTPFPWLLKGFPFNSFDSLSNTLTAPSMSPDTIKLPESEYSRQFIYFECGISAFTLNPLDFISTIYKFYYPVIN
jgi:hypothetical protein